MNRTYQIGDVAAISGVSVRTLHYYEEIGLLAPGARTAAGYRLYTDDDLLRLQQILLNRELGLPLNAIRRLIDDPQFDRREALLQQRAQLLRRAEQTSLLIKAIDAALAVIDIPEKEEDKMIEFKEIFNGFDPEDYAAEAEQRWGDGDAFRDSIERTQNYTEEGWLRFRDESSAIYADACTALKSGLPPDSPEAMAIAERHRLSIDLWFYPCSPAMHCGLADMYESDHRFAENIDKAGPGLTKFLSAAIRANARRDETE